MSSSFVAAVFRPGYRGELQCNASTLGRLYKLVASSFPPYTSACMPSIQREHPELYFTSNASIDLQIANGCFFIPHLRALGPAVPFTLHNSLHPEIFVEIHWHVGMSSLEHLLDGLNSFVSATTASAPALATMGIIYRQLACLCRVVVLLPACLRGQDLEHAVHQVPRPVGGI